MTHPGRLGEIFSGRRLATVELAIASFPDPHLLEVRLSRILASSQAREWAHTSLFEEEGVTTPLFASLVRTLAQSEFLTFILEREPGLLVSFQSDREFARSSGPEVFLNELTRHLEALADSDDFRTGLARFKLHEIFRIAVRDITERAPIEVLARELSDLADFVLRAAYDKAYAETLLAFGAPRLPSGQLAEMGILSMGKHGGRELNFSSDLDLIFLYDGEGKTDLEGQMQAYLEWLEAHPFARYLSNPVPKARMRPAPFEAFFNSLGTRLIEILSDPGPLGNLYRIDMRLRPHGSSGALVQTLEGALSYYQNWGERWERQALLRVRFCIGPDSLGSRFQQETAGFVFRKYVDDTEVEETLRDMRELRFRSIAQSGASDEERSRNVKNGPGGIRDIEFLVQAVQTLYSGSFPELRVGNVFELLRRTHQSGLMDASDYHILSTGYELLRRLEHRVQMDDLQRYHLPSDPALLNNLAVGLGYADGDTLMEDYGTTTRSIHKIFRVVFRVEEEEDRLGDLVDLKNLTPEAARRLSGFGLSDPEGVFRSIGRLAQDPDSPHLNSKLRRLLKNILPRILKHARETPHPDLAWKTFETKALSTPARSTFYSVIEESPQFLHLLLDLGAASPYLADLMARSPNLVEDLLRRADFDRPFVERHIESLYGDEEGASHGESELPLVRSFRKRADMHIAGRFALGLSSVSEATSEITTLAEFCLRKASEETWILGAVGMVLFGLGKLGGRELGFGSDLDLVAFYDDRLQRSSEVPQRLVAKMMNEMNVATEDGTLFEADLRLRPHGKSSPLVPSIQSALEYYREEGQTWERLALTRCRPLLGEGVLMEEIRDHLFGWVFAEPAALSDLAEIREMRRRIEREKPKEVLKAGPGGLVDVEFIAQTGQLVWACDRPELRSANTCEAIQAFVRGNLIQAEIGSVLCSSYCFLRDLENRLRLLGKSGSQGLPKDPETVAHLARCINHAHRQKHGSFPEHPWTPETLESKTRATLQRVREIFEHLFEKGFIETR